MQRTPEIAGGQKQQLKMFSAREKQKNTVTEPTKRLATRRGDIFLYPSQIG